MTVSLEHLWGFEAHVHAAAEEIQFPLPLLGPGAASDFRVYMTPLFRTRDQQRMYRKSTGRVDDTILEFYDPRGDKTRVSHTFQMHRDDHGKRREARTFLIKIKRHLAAALKGEPPPEIEAVE